MYMMILNSMLPKLITEISEKKSKLDSLKFTSLMHKNNIVNDFRGLSR